MWNTFQGRCVALHFCFCAGMSCGLFSTVVINVPIVRYNVRVIDE